MQGQDKTAPVQPVLLKSTRNPSTGTKVETANHTVSSNLAISFSMKLCLQSSSEPQNTACWKGPNLMKWSSSPSPGSIQDNPKSNPITESIIQMPLELLGPCSLGPCPPTCGADPFLNPQLPLSWNSSMPFPQARSPENSPNSESVALPTQKVCIQCPRLCCRETDAQTLQGTVA